MKKRIIPISALFVVGILTAQTAPSNSENYIYSKTYLSDPSLPATAKLTETVQYFDGLGRPSQVINVKTSPTGKDLVTNISYDQFGRQADTWLPAPMVSSNGAIQSGVNTAAQLFYGDVNPFSHQNLESTPLNRTLSQVQPGVDWQQHPVTFEYEVNGNDVNKYVAKFNYSTLQPSLILSGTYSGNQLYKSTKTDEDGGVTIEFKDKQGHIVLIRKMLNLADKADTYYVYNEYNQLAYIIPPLASVSGNVNESTLDMLCYQYKYDGRGRLIEKKLPGKGKEFMIYDKQDRLVGTQDAELNKKGQWLYTQYDQFGRVVLTGIATGGDRNAEQTLADTSGNVLRSSSVIFNRQGMDVYYDPGTTYPSASKWVALLTINYYDSYPQYGFNPSVVSVLGETVLTGGPSSDGRSTKGLPVMSLIKNIEDDNWTKGYIYYDSKGRVIGKYSINHLGGYTRTESKLDFTGLPKQTITKHKRLDTDTERVITEDFEYDNQNRLLVHKHQVDSKPIEYLAQNTYNEISQLISKKVGGITAAAPLQQMDYHYNIRGWMTKINDPSNLNGKLFGYEIKYQNPVNPQGVGKFNGNISEISWNNGSENLLKRYNYEYDKSNRLVNAFYKEPSTGNSGYFDEYLTYDFNGNIKTLKRNAAPVSQGTTQVQVDDLTYQYTGNRLDKVIETAMNDSGYEGGNNIIDYDLNGSMTTMKDKGILGIVYNHLSLPDSYSITQSNPFGLPMNIGLDYLYRADGVKLRKTYSSTPPRGLTSVTITDYLDGFQYNYFEGGGICITCRTENAYEQEAYKGIIDPGTITPEWKLDFVHTAEGVYSFAENRYIYQYKDHLGNNRVSFGKDSTGALEIIDTNNYYAFGLNHIGAVKGLLGGYKNYKYQEQELQETGFYSFKWRNYMPDLGRFFNIDPLTEKFVYNSPYAFSENRVIDGRELEGLEWSASRNLDNKTVDINYKYKAVNNTNGVLSDKQMAVLNRERNTQTALSLNGRDSEGYLTRVTFTESDNATIVREYNVSYDTNNVDDFKNMDPDSLTWTLLNTNGMADNNNNTQINRTQINVYTTEGMPKDANGNLLFDKRDSKKLAQTGAHEDIHTAGQKHKSKVTLASPPDDLMREGATGTKITPEQRTEIIKLIEQQQPKR
ncbi:RHS repeat-associated core domain-containing protein [Chryseobacterium gleum]|uniref:DUF6443 domain-containing protein n=1 Tax=Chryseobacterium gleum TaxID=250 RepID=UPI00103DE336|nr:DUF6443 domain-containing protein [Chryseobacterium gleum]QBJ85146.1 RHS repeat-associated core domain-containing protein [Chryseobacterium gleum]